jgi:hypothetical protein
MTPATISIYAMEIKCPALANSSTEAPVANCRVAMSVIYERRIGVSLSLGTVIPNVWLNAMGLSRACIPVATVETPKMSAIPLKTRRRVEVGMVGVWRAWWYRSNGLLCLEGNRMTESGNFGHGATGTLGNDSELHRRIGC